MPHARPVDRLARPAPQVARRAGDSASVTLAVPKITLQLAFLSRSTNTVSLTGRNPDSRVISTALVAAEVEETFSAVGR